MSDIELRPAWLRHDTTIERDARQFWLAQDLLPKGVDPGARLSQICAAAYLDNELIALSTATIRMVDFLRCKLAMFRVLVAPDTRLKQVASKLAVFTRDILENWSKENPEQEVMGLGAVIQSRLLVENNPYAVYPDTKLAFIGYTQEGYQMRVYWFAHATISKYWPGDEGAGLAEKERQA